VLQLLIAGSKNHAFLDRAWIPWLVRLTPRPLRQRLSLSLLGLSNHYWVYQWTDYYAPELRRGEILRHEFERNASSRQEICDKLLRRFVRPDMTVLDFGCGPGFLARLVSAHVKQVIATDVSRGVLACARVLNPAGNLTYVQNGLADLRRVADASIDLLYSIAVVQHLTKEQNRAFFKEFARVLKPNGTGAVHANILPENAEKSPRFDADTGNWISKRVKLRMDYFTPSEVTRLLGEAGFSHVRITRIDTLTDIDDDIGNEHLVTFSR
jgi:cyclopropane fatty-acyl-phospholipid synthase-like methyltransferase